MRYTFEHAVPLVDHWDGQQIGGEPRISVMLRVSLPSLRASGWADEEESTGPQAAVA